MLHTLALASSDTEWFFYSVPEVEDSSGSDSETGDCSEDGRIERLQDVTLLCYIPLTTEDRALQAI